MDLLSNMDSAKWQNAQPDHVHGLQEYTILKNKLVQPGKIEYALRENKDDGNLIMGVLEGARGKGNPLQAARNIEMKVENGIVIAINLEGDCIVRK